MFWQKSMDLTKSVYFISAEMNSDEKFGLISQIRRASISIPSNIVKGSAFELQTQLILIKNLKIIEEKKISYILENMLKSKK